MPGPPTPSTLLVGGAVVAVLVALHLWSTQGSGTLAGARLAGIAITPDTTLGLWWRHLWAGLFHKSWGHIAYNLVVFAVAFPFAAKQMHPALTMANAYWIGPFVVFCLHLLLVLPLAHAGVPYAVKALHYPLVGFSVMAYSIAGAALTLAPAKAAAVAFGAIVASEAVMAIVSTGPLVSVYHVGGLALGYWVRALLLRAGTTG